MPTNADICDVIAPVENRITRPENFKEKFLTLVGRGFTRVGLQGSERTV